VSLEYISVKDVLSVDHFSVRYDIKVKGTCDIVKCLFFCEDWIYWDAKHLIAPFLYLFPVFPAFESVVLFYYDQDVDITSLFEIPSCCTAEEDDRGYLLIHGLFYDFEQGLDLGAHGLVLLQLCVEYVYFVVFRVRVCLMVFCASIRGFVCVCFSEDWGAASGRVRRCGVYDGGDGRYKKFYIILNFLYQPIKMSNYFSQTFYTFSRSKRKWEGST